MPAAPAARHRAKQHRATQRRATQRRAKQHRAKQHRAQRRPTPRRALYLLGALLALPALTAGGFYLASRPAPAPASSPPKVTTLQT